jgi:hypothetical protein
MIPVYSLKWIGSKGGSTRLGRLRLQLSEEAHYRRVYIRKPPSKENTHYAFPT